MGVFMNGGLVLVFILFFMYSIYIIRNNMISIAGVKIKRSPMLLAAQLSQMLVLVLLFSFSGTFIHSTSILLFMLGGLFLGEMFILKRDLNKYFMQVDGKHYGLGILGIRHIIVFICQSIMLVLLGLYYW